MKLFHITLPALVVAMFLSGGVVLPATAQAAYSFRGQTFATQSEYNSFVAEYMRVWRALQDSNDSQAQESQTSRNVVDNTTTTSGVGGVSSGASGASGATSGASGSGATSGASGGSTSGADELSSAPSSGNASSIVTTSLARDIAADNAWLTGEFDIARGRYATVWFEYGFSPSWLTRLSDYQVLRSYGGDTDYDQRIRGLVPQTKYYYRAVAKTADGLVHYGSVRSFTTPIDYDSTESLVTITTDRVTDIDEDRATLSSRVKFGDSAYATVWFLYGTDKNDMYRFTRGIEVVPNGSWFSNTYATIVLDKITPETVYYVRAVAQDDMGVYAYGDIVTFTTQRDIENEQPKITLGRVEEITGYSATFKATIDMNDGEDGTVFLVYGEDNEAIRRIATSYRRYSEIRERGDSIQKVLLETGLWDYAEFTPSVRDLEPNTRYYYAFGIEYDNVFGARMLTLTYPTSFGTLRQ